MRAAWASHDVPFGMVHGPGQRSPAQPSACSSPFIIARNQLSMQLKPYAGSHGKAASPSSQLFERAKRYFRSAQSSMSITGFGSRVVWGAVGGAVGGVAFCRACSGKPARGKASEGGTGGGGGRSLMRDAAEWCLDRQAEPKVVCEACMAAAAAAAAAAHSGEEQRVQLDILSVIKPGNTREKIAFFIRNQCNSWNGQLKVKNPWEQGCTKAKRRRKSQDSDVALAQNARSVPEAACQCSTSAFKEPDERMANACSDGLESCNENVLSESDMLSVLEKVALLEGKSAREGVGRSRVGSSSSAHASDAAAVSQEPDHLQKHSLDAACSPPVSCSVGDSLARAWCDRPHVETWCERVRVDSGTQPSACGELPAESVRVTEAIARLELESLKQQQPGDRTSCSLSRNSSLRRSFKKISISSSAASCSSASAASQPARDADATDTFSAEALAGEDCSLSLASSPAVQTSPSNDRCTLTAGATVENFVQISSTPASPAVVDGESKIDLVKGPFCSQLVASAEGQSPADVVCQDPKVCKTSPSLCVALSSVCKSLCTRDSSPSGSTATKPAEVYDDTSSGDTKGMALTGLQAASTIRLAVDGDVAGATEQSTHCTEARTEPDGCANNEGSSLADLIPGQLFLLVAPAVSEKGSEKSLAPALSEVTSGDCVEEQSSPKLSPSKCKKAVSHEFLETRFRIQQLLEPRQYMLSLPDHVLAQMFGYLPTRCLAALKCTCRDFKWLIEAYDIRATDSRWSDDPRYSDDPCKQCRKRYQRGDVSLCRWHPKPYHRDLLYGRSYWMCCRKPDRDAAGCKVGLHDNNWVQPSDRLQQIRRFSAEEH